MLNNAMNDSMKHQLDEDEGEDSKIFPQKLMEILSNEEYADAICWLPHGKSFVIRNRDLFAENVMPKFFSRKAKYSSFTRKLNRWNFVRTASGPEMGSYFHQFFCRDKPQLTAQMYCKNARSKLAMASNETSPVVSAKQPEQPKIHPSVMAALSKEGPAGESLGIGAAAPVLGISNLQLLERQVQLMQEEYAQRLLLQRLALEEQAANNLQLQQMLLLRQQAGEKAYSQLQQMMEARSRQRQGLMPSNGRASAA